MRSIRIISSTVVLLACAFVAAAAELSELKDSVVRVTTAESDGAGIIIGSDERTVFVATASHVVPASDVSVQFNGARHRTFAGRVFRQSGTVDFAVVAVDVPADDPIRRSFRSIEYREGAVPLLSVVSNIGHASGQWEANFGVNKLQSEELNTLGFSKLGVVQGASGGPLFDDANRLIGMVTEIDAARASALKVSAILSLLSSWNVQSNLLEAEKCVVSIRSTPPGAHVLIGGTSKGKTPITMPVSRAGGGIAIVLRKDGYMPVTTTADCSNTAVDADLRESIPQSIIGPGVTDDDVRLVFTAASFAPLREVDPRLQKIMLAMDTPELRAIVCSYLPESANDLKTFSFGSFAFVYPTEAAAVTEFEERVKTVRNDTNYEEVSGLVSVGDEKFSAYFREAGTRVRTHFFVRQGRVLHTLQVSGLFLDDVNVVNQLFEPVLRESARLGAGD